MTFTRTARFGLVTLHVGEPERFPFEPDAIVIPQDRWLVMDATTPVADTPRSYDELARQGDGPGVSPGSVLARRGEGVLRLWAVVHDLEASPTCRREWVDSALLGVLRQVVNRRLHALILPAMGCAEGVVSLEGFLDALAAAVREAALVTRLQIWIPVPTSWCERAREALEAMDL